MAGPGNSIRPGCQHVLVPDAGEEQHAAEQHRAEAREEQQRGADGEREARHTQHRGFDDGRRVALASAARAAAAGPRATSEQGDHAARAPAPFLSLDDRHHERADGDDQHRGAEQVGTCGVLLAALAQGAQAGDQRRQAEREC